ncbi:hypothetical protein QRD43_20760 [Pelomonas sp. APW6]|uniref:Uncharacterized protein n=1 Tax=Roseateles subflavus TaxID=3053353 RepID=A0ABT7LSA0_9BURK|nr:hypothetical protein [Pelomonas sp. APW6]MDL5034346.1 hypothetical protein [Pelomonas sp. APW6]
MNTAFHTLYTVGVEEKPDPRLALITGAAIKLMAEAGADAGVIGHFALRYPSIVAAQLAPPPSPPPVQEIDIEALVRTTVEMVLGLSGGGQDGDARPRAVKSKRGRGVDLVKRNVTVGGKRTSISLSAELFRKVVAVGGNDQADKLIQSFVDQTPASELNRSAWVESQITQHLVLNQMTGDGARAH